MYTSKFKMILHYDKEIKDKQKIRYYKEVINSNIEYQNKFMLA